MDYKSFNNEDWPTLPSSGSFGEGFAGRGRGTMYGKAQQTKLTGTQQSVQVRRKEHTPGRGRERAVTNALISKTLPEVGELSTISKNQSQAGAQLLPIREGGGQKIRSTEGGHQTSRLRKDNDQRSRSQEGGHQRLSSPEVHHRSSISTTLIVLVIHK